MPAANSRLFRDCLGRFASGVTVVTVSDRDGVHGATVSSFTSVSLDPPLILVSLDRRSRLCGRLGAIPFGINVLAATQSDVAQHFAGRPDAHDGPIRWRHQGPAPRLAGCAAFLECSAYAAYDGGDHVLFLGRVEAFETSDVEPLVFHRGSFRELLGRRPSAAWHGSFDHPFAYFRGER